MNNLVQVLFYDCDTCNGNNEVEKNKLEKQLKSRYSVKKTK